MLAAATIIAKHTSSLCNACRVASSKTANPVAKRHFVQSAKDVANATAKLVKEIKALDQDYSEQNRGNCAAATQPLIEAVDNLCAFANSPDFASIPAKISPAGRQAQEPITSAGTSTTFSLSLKFSVYTKCWHRIQNCLWGCRKGWLSDLLVVCSFFFYCF